MLVTLKIAKPDMLEDGVPVLLGNVEDAAGEDFESLPAEEEEADVSDASEVPEEVEEVAETPQPSDVKPQLSTPPAPQITQTQEKSIAAEEAKRKEEARKKLEEEAARKKAIEEAEKKRAAEEAAAKKRAEEEAKRKAEAEAARIRAEEEARKAAVNNKVSGAFGKGGNQGSSGNTAGNGNQGGPNGNSTSGAVSGAGGIGVANVAGRSATKKPVPSVATPSSGKIIVNILVDSNGKVIDASIGTNEPKDPSLNPIFLATAKKWEFTPGNDNVKGSITFTIPPPANR